MLDVTVEPFDRDSVVVRWRSPDGEAPPVSVTVGTEAAQLASLPPLLASTDAGDAVVPRAGLRTYVRVERLDEPGAIWVGGERVVALPGARNLRDLGGYPIPGGAATAWGKLYRGEALIAAPEDVDRSVGGALRAALDDDGLKLLEGIGLRTVIDLRIDSESRRFPSVLVQLADAEVFSFPLPDRPDVPAGSIAEGLVTGDLQRFSSDDLVASYRKILDRHAETFGQVVETLGRPHGLPALMHCAGGKDRTGLVSALVLSLVGVSAEVIIDDYCLSEVCRPNRVEVYRPMLAEMGVNADDIAAVFKAPAEAMAAALEHIDSRYGSAREYLSGPARVSRNTLDRLAAELTVHP